MPIVDLPLPELRKYDPPLTRTKDFERFWKENIGLAEEQQLNEKWTEVEFFTHRIKVSRVTFDGFSDKSPISGFFIQGGSGAESKPTLVQLHGYGGHKGRVTDHLAWISLGFSIFTIDVRGQTGESPDYASYSQGSRGYMAKGIESESSYFYRFVYMDCYRAVKTILGREGVDESKLGTSGTSQGGGLSIATAALNPNVKLMMSAIPFLCHFDRAVSLSSGGPYPEILDYLREHPEREEMVYRTLSYFDAMNLAPMVKVPSLVSVGLLDTICPPSTVFATYNHLGTREKELAVYPGVGHEDLGVHVERKMRWAVEHISPDQRTHNSAKRT